MEWFIGYKCWGKPAVIKYDGDREDVLTFVGDSLQNSGVCYIGSSCMNAMHAASTNTVFLDSIHPVTIKLGTRPQMEGKRAEDWRELDVYRRMLVRMFGEQNFSYKFESNGPGLGVAILVLKLANPSVKCPVAIPTYWDEQALAELK